MSSATEEIRVPDVVFNGIDGKECEAFVVAIQEFAFSKGLDQDHSWMLRLATTRLRGKALRWYAGLDPSMKKDWDLFVQALFGQYPTVEASDDGAIATPIWPATTFISSLSAVTLAANPGINPNSTTLGLPLDPSIPRPWDATSEGQQIGILCIVTKEGTRLPQYVWRDYTAEEIQKHEHTSASYYSYPKMATVYRHEALIVGFLPSSTPHQIGCLNSRADLRTLTICYEFTSNQENFTVYGSGTRQSFVSDAVVTTSGYVSKAWNILADGTLQASVSSRNNKFTTTEVHVDCAGKNIRFVKPGALLEQDKPNSNPRHPLVRARIVFEPL